MTLYSNRSFAALPSRESVGFQQGEPLIGAPIIVVHLTTGAEVPGTIQVVFGQHIYKVKTENGAFVLRSWHQVKKK